jgi:hypothetical protein
MDCALVAAVMTSGPSCKTKHTDCHKLWQVHYFCKLGGQHDCCHTIGVSMPMKSGFVGAGAGRRSSSSQTLAPPHNRTEVVAVPRVSMGRKKVEASDPLAPAPRRIASHQSTRRAAASRAKTKWLEKCLATRASKNHGVYNVIRVSNSQFCRFCL